MRWPWQKKDDREDETDPRGTVETVDGDYLEADPRDIVEADGTAMAGPGGAPQEETTADERREQQRP